MILPTPPNDYEKYKYIHTRRYSFYIPSVIAFILLMTGIFLFSLSHPYFWIYGLFGVVLSFYLFISYLIGFIGKDFSLSFHSLILENFGKRYQPTVDVFYACCGEDVQVIRNAMKYISQITYDHVNVYVLDDGASKEVEELAEFFGFIYIVRPNRGELKKAGNLRYAFNHSSGEFILILDADFCPRSDILKEMIPWMHYDQNIAIIQTPQYFTIQPGQTWIEKGAAYIQELFYRMIQVSRDNFDGSICVGTCALYRREALDPFGGTAAIGYSEDVHTGFQIMKLGYKVRYLPIILAKGVCPDRLSAFFLQQYRWAMGSISLFLNKDFWQTKLTVMQRVAYLSGMLYYITTGVFVFLTPLPAMILVAFYPELVFWYNSVFSLPSFIFGVFGVAAWTKAPFGWYALKARQVSYYAHFFAFKDKLFGTLVPWQPTGAVKSNERFELFTRVITSWTILQVVWIFGFVAIRVNQYGWLNFIPMVLFTAFNTWIALSSIKE